MCHQLSWAVGLLVTSFIGSRCCYWLLNNVILFLCSIPGEALVDAGEAFKQLADIKYSLEDSVRQNFLEPLHNLQTKDLKEVNV